MLLTILSNRFLECRSLVLSLSAVIVHLLLLCMILFLSFSGLLFPFIYFLGHFVDLPLLCLPVTGLQPVHGPLATPSPLLSRRKGPQHECPDYVTGGPNSCYFDSQHTQVWEVYCMTVTAQGGGGSLTSEEHCLDVADIGK